MSAAPLTMYSQLSTTELWAQAFIERNASMSTDLATIGALDADHALIVTLDCYRTANMRERRSSRIVIVTAKRFDLKQRISFVHHVEDLTGVIGQDALADKIREDTPKVGASLLHRFPESTARLIRWAWFHAVSWTDPVFDPDEIVYFMNKEVA